MRTRKTGLLIALTLLFLLAAGILLQSYGEFVGEGPLTTGQAVVIRRGTDLDDIARLLKTEGIINNAALFRLGVRVFGNARRLKAGEFFIPPSSSAKEVMDVLVKGEVVLHALTIPEGLSSARIVELVEKTPALAGDISEIPPSGTLLPETYHYTYETPRSALLERMRLAMTQYVDSLWENRNPELPYQTQEEALSMAALIERETALDAERPIVASVFINRLRKGMRLQSDPTVIYAVTNGETRMNRALTFADLRVQHPHNTYVNKGLPPTPICNPGRASIAAALQPADTNYLFFVADGRGGHTFSVTYETHKKKVQDWRKVSRKGKGKTP